MTKPYYTLANFTGPNALGYLVRRLHTLMVPCAEAQFAGEELTFSHWVALVPTHACPTRRRLASCGRPMHHRG